jgi:hypothetical protein
MPVNYVKGDILEETAVESGKLALVFGAASGIAAAAKKRWPGLGEALDGATGAAAKTVEPGEMLEWRHGDLFIFALGIQRGDAKPKVSWIERSVRSVIARAETEGIRRILVPRLGGDWSRVKKLLGEIGATTTIDLVVFEQFVRKSAT